MREESEKKRHRHLVEAMSDPGFYPGAVQSVEHRQTHISDVFLTGELVYKIKKPVTTGFLDFTTLERRRHYCWREVELNQRLTRGIYLDVVAVARDGDHFYLGEDTADAVEYAVKMRQLDDHDSLDMMISHNSMPRNFLPQLTDVLIRFYQESQASEEIARAGEVERILTNCRENFDQIPDIARQLIDPQKLRFIRAVAEGFGHRHRDLFARRVAQERIRDCHGDLKTEHIYHAEGVQIIDCIEFNDQLRFQDPAADLAFLAMDMDYLGQPSAAQQVLNRYVHQTGDDELMLLIDFYKCYRAMVQVKVQGLKLAAMGVDGGGRRQLTDAVSRYVDLAYHYGVKMVRPVIWVVCGLTAAGKSTIARRLAELLAVKWVRSDRIRKEIFGGRGKTDSGFGTAIYSSAATAHVYGRMLLAVQEEVTAGRSVVVDGTYRRYGPRKEIMRLAEDRHASIIFVACRCPEELTRKRLKAREKQPGLSDARLEHWQYIKSTSDPYDDIPPGSYLALDTVRPVAECIEYILAAVQELLAGQVREMFSEYP